jgi:hypothetical protein
MARHAGAALRIVSGGQTGVDRAALDAARTCGLGSGGWCPAGRAAEDGVIPERYALAETPSADPAQRSEWNVRDADATWVVWPAGADSAGTSWTIECAARAGVPLLLTPPDPGLGEAVRCWLDALAPGTLNVAGPRESEAPGVYADARALIETVLRGR